MRQEAEGDQTEAEVVKQKGKVDAEPRRAKLGALLRPNMTGLNP